MSKYYHPHDMTQLPYHQRVLCGMAYIDRQLPEQRWHEAVDIDALDMNLTDKDIVSATLSRGGADHASEKLGFYTRNLNHHDLTATWRAMLHLRNALPTLPAHHVFLGVGKDDNDPEACQWGIRHCFGWGGDSQNTPEWEKGWAPECSSAMTMNHVAYCTNCANPAAQTLLDALPPEHKEKTVTQQSEDKDEKYRKEIHINADQDIDAYGYTFSVADVDVLDYYIEQTGELTDAGFDLEMAAVTIGCRRFEIEELRGLIRAYRDMKREEHEQREQIFVTCGDRLAKKCPGGGLSSQYMVAQIGYDDYILVSTTSGNRWNSVVVRGAEDYRRMSLRSFLTDSDAPSDWSKIS